MAKDTLPLCVDYKSFANDDNGLLPYLAECAKKLTMREADDELDQLIDDIEAVSDALDNLAEEIVQMREEYDELKERRDTIRSVIAKQREAEREIKNQMFDFFGEVPDDQSDDIPDDENNVSLEDLMQEADLISKNNLGDMVDDSSSEWDKQAPVPPQQSVNNVPRRSHAAAIAEQQNSDVAPTDISSDIPKQASANVATRTELAQQSMLENDESYNEQIVPDISEENSDLFSELDALDISDSLPDAQNLSSSDNDGVIDLAQSGLILDDDIDNLSDDPNEMLAEEYGGLIDPVENDTENKSNPLSEINTDENEEFDNLGDDDLFGDDSENQPVANNDEEIDDNNNFLFGDDNDIDDDFFGSFINDDMIDDYASDESAPSQNEEQNIQDDDYSFDDDFDDINDILTIDNTPEQEKQQQTTQAPRRQSRASRNARGLGTPQFIDPNIFS